MNTRWILLILLLACRSPVEPDAPCLPSQQWWAFMQTDNQGNMIINAHGCATPEQIAFIEANCMAGKACPPPKE